MKFNVSKCHSMRVTRLHPSRQIEFNYTLHQQTLEQVQSAKYLGLTITDDLDWGQHISEITYINHDPVMTLTYFTARGMGKCNLK